MYSTSVSNFCDSVVVPLASVRVIILEVIHSIAGIFYWEEKGREVKRGERGEYRV